MSKKKLKEKEQEDAEYDSLEIVEDDHDMSYYQRNKEEVVKVREIEPVISKV